MPDSHMSTYLYAHGYTNYMDIKLREEFRERFAKELNGTGLSITKIGEKVGIDYTLVSHYIKGRKIPSLETFILICRALDLNANYIVGLED